MNKRTYILGHEGHPHFFSDKTVGGLSKKYKKEPAKQQDLLLLLKNLSDPTKLKIYLLLSEVKEMAVTDIVNILGSSQSAISHALSDLKKLNLVECHRCGQLICYSLTKQQAKRKSLLTNFTNVFSRG